MNNPTDPNETERNELLNAIREIQEAADERVRRAQEETRIAQEGKRRAEETVDRCAIDIRYEIFMEQRKTIKKLANMPLKNTENKIFPPPLFITKAHIFTCIGIFRLNH